MINQNSCGNKEFGRRRGTPDLHNRGATSAYNHCVCQREAASGGETPLMAKVVEQQDLLDKWSVQDSAELYGIRHWSKGYFGINKDGHVVVHPDKRPEHAIDLKQLIDDLQARGIQLPILLRFTDILRHRVGEIHDAFKAAMQEFAYQGGYC